MKLYTEEQVKQAIKKSFTPKNKNGDALNYWFTTDEVIKSLTPIELPSDEKIEEEIQATNEGINAHWKIEGAKWMKEQILNQNK